jgi:hypothetical protein
MGKCRPRDLFAVDKSIRSWARRSRGIVIEVRNPKSYEPNGIIGRKPSCGHVVAVDVDDTPEHRAEFERRGYTIEVYPRSVAVRMMDSEHAACIGH